MVSRTKSGETWSFRWTPFDKPRFISKDGMGSEFRYDSNRQRAVHLKFDSMTGGQDPEPVHYTTKKLYFGNRMEADFVNLASGAAQDWQIKNIRVYIDGPDGRTGAYEFHPNQPPVDRPKPLVYHQDHLGSIDAITEYGVATATFAMDEQGNPSRFSYDPWGDRRDPLDWSGTPTSSTTQGGEDDLTPRGFTDHEMLDDLGLVHMNGRIYDGQLGRFLSADLVVQAPGDLQSYNRYSYVRNNPLTLFDPDGYQDRRKPSAAVIASRQRYREQWNNSGGGKIYNGIALTIAGTLPYVGDTLDIKDVVSPDSAGWERGVAGASLTLNAATGGLAPNAGPIIDGLRSIGSGVVDLVRGGSDAARAAGNTAEATADALHSAPTPPVKAEAPEPVPVEVSNTPPTEAAKGGPYNQVRQENTVAGNGGEVHHMPSQQALRENGMPTSTGSSVHMEIPDHRTTASHGSQGLAGAEFRAAESAAIAEGNFEAAVQMGIDDLLEKFPNGEYDQHVLEMLEDLNDKL